MSRRLPASVTWLLVMVENKAERQQPQIDFLHDLAVQSTLPWASSNSCFAPENRNRLVASQRGAASIHREFLSRGRHHACYAVIHDLDPYSSTQGEATLVAGRGSMSLKNNANNVSLDLASQTTGIALGISGQGLTIDMPEPPVNAPRVYVLEFGFNKDFVNADSRKALNELMEAWKCQYANIEVAGHTDTVGKESDNLNLSELRAQAVRNYLVGGGVVPTRIATHVAGESDLQVPTANSVRLRSNRVAIVTIH